MRRSGKLKEWCNYMAYKRMAGKFTNMVLVITIFISNFSWGSYFDKKHLRVPSIQWFLKKNVQNFATELYSNISLGNFPSLIEKAPSPQALVELTHMLIFVIGFKTILKGLKDSSDENSSEFTTLDFCNYRWFIHNILIGKRDIDKKLREELGMNKNSSIDDISLKELVNKLNKWRLTDKDKKWLKICYKEMPLERSYLFAKALLLLDQGHTIPVNVETPIKKAILKYLYNEFYIQYSIFDEDEGNVLINVEKGESSLFILKYLKDEKIDYHEYISEEKIEEIKLHVKRNTAELFSEIDLFFKQQLLL
ncbi:MAG: hypothetical protein ABII74_03730 [Elusimicrobiota bacterium]